MIKTQPNARWSLTRAEKQKLKHPVCNPKGGHSHIQVLLIIIKTLAGNLNGVSGGQLYWGAGCLQEW